MSHLENLKQIQAKQDGVETVEPTDVILPSGVIITDDTELVVDTPPEPELEPEISEQEKADLVVTSKSDLEAMIKDIVKAYDVKIEAADNKIDRLALTIEMQEKKTAVKRTKGSGVTVTPRSHNVPDHMAILAGAHKGTLDGRIGRFVNNRPDMRSLRRFQGYDPVLDKDGNEVRYMDGVLMSISKDRHKKEIQQPREERKQFRAESIGTKFKEDAAKAGVEIIGDGIIYDEEYTVPSKT